MSWQRIRFLFLRYAFLYSRNFFRLLDMFFWPLMDLLVWGFVSLYVMRVPNAAPPLATFFVGAIIFWVILYRCQQGVTISFLEDVWNRNLLNVFVAPVRVSEFVVATYLVGLVQSLVVLVFMTTLSRIFYSFDLLVMGANLVPLFINLLFMGWSIGMLSTALIIRFGQAAEALAWAIPFLVQPISAVFYPVDVLPSWLQPVALCLPSTHVFEGMRKVLMGGTLSVNSLLLIFVLSAAYMVAAGWFFQHMFNQARQKGLLTKLGTS